MGAAVFNCAEKHSTVALPEKLLSACDQVVQYGINYPVECTDRPEFTGV